MRKKLLSMLVLLAAVATGAMAQEPATYKVTLQEGTEDATNWTIPKEAAEGATVTATYTGKLKVKSVKAVKKGGAAPEKTYYYGNGYYTVDGGSGGITTSEKHNSLVDNNLGTKWGQDKPDGGWYIEFHTASAIQVDGYMLRTGNDTQGQSNRNPTDWVLKGKKNSGDSWTVIDTKVNNNDLPNENDAETDFDVATPGEYRYFRLEISNNKGNGGFMQLSEMRLFKYVTWNATTKQATFTMPDGDVELEVEYFAESNLYLSEEALKDKANISVTAGDLGVEFGEDGKSANTVTEGTPVTVTYTGTRHVKGVKVEKKAAKPVTLATALEDGAIIKVNFKWRNYDKGDYVQGVYNAASGTFTVSKGGGYWGSDARAVYKVEKSGDNIIIGAGFSDYNTEAMVWTFNTTNDTYTTTNGAEVKKFPTEYGLISVSVNDTDITSTLSELK